MKVRSGREKIRVNLRSDIPCVVRHARDARSEEDRTLPPKSSREVGDRVTQEQVGLDRLDERRRFGRSYAVGSKSSAGGHGQRKTFEAPQRRALEEL